MSDEAVVFVCLTIFAVLIYGEPNLLSKLGYYLTECK